MRPKRGLSAQLVEGGTSGDLLADRRYLHACALSEEGDHAAAADLLAQTLERAPHWPVAWSALGHACLAQGDGARARVAFGQALRLDPADAIGASLALAALDPDAMPAAAPARFVARLFDGYASRFDAHLQEGLGYRAPALLRAALDAVARPPRRFARALDIGCGTGLGGAALRDRVDRLCGVDLSPRMIEQAAAKALYDELSTGDLMAALETTPACDLILAADVLIYTGDLASVFAAAHRALSPGGLFAFTLQRADAGTGVCVGPDLRFSHAPDHVASRATAAGLAVAAWDTASTRRDGGADVPGLVVVLRR